MRSRTSRHRAAVLVPGHRRSLPADRGGRAVRPVGADRGADRVGAAVRRGVRAVARSERGGRAARGGRARARARRRRAAGRGRDDRDRGRVPERAGDGRGRRELHAVGVHGQARLPRAAVAHGQLHLGGGRRAADASAGRPHRSHPSAGLALGGRAGRARGGRDRAGIRDLLPADRRGRRGPGVAGRVPDTADLVGPMERRCWTSASLRPR